MPSRRSYGAGTPPIDVIVRAARDLIDHYGLESLSMRGLAEHLDIHQPAVYRRVRDRAALLDLVAESIVADAGLPGVDGADWRGWLLDCAGRLRRAWAAHPNAAPLVYRGGGTHTILLLFDTLFAVLARAGFRGEDQMDVAEIYLGYVFGTTFLAAIPHSLDAEPLDAERQSRYPNIRRSQELAAARRGTTPRVDSFVAGLEALLDGLASGYQARPASPPTPPAPPTPA